MDIKQCCSQLKDSLPNLNWVTSPIQLKRLSKDFYWFSPLLVEQLANKKADSIVKPRNIEELKTLVSACARQKIPITIRGAGTGNYGQAVPLHGGIIIDMTLMNKVISWQNDRVTVEAGIRLGDLEALAKTRELELRCMPSTYKMATIGGLFSGGFGGIGSINYGPFSAPGTVVEIEVLTIEQTPKTLKFTGQDILQFQHMYGTNGIITKIEVSLAPAHQWHEYALAFNTLDESYQFAHYLAYTDNVKKRNVALFDQKSAKYLPNMEHLMADEYTIIALIAEQSIKKFEHQLAMTQGRVLRHMTPVSSQQDSETLMESCWNHSTLHALKHEKSMTYLQTQYDSNNALQQIKTIHSKTEDKIGLHIEFIRDSDGMPMIVGLPVFKYQTEAQLNNLISEHQKIDVTINNPHVYTLEDGQQRGKLQKEIIDLMRCNDPKSLLNKGKVKSLLSN